MSTTGGRSVCSVAWELARQHAPLAATACGPWVSDGSTSVTRRLILNQPCCPAAGEHHVLDRADAAQVGRAKSRR